MMHYQNLECGNQSAVEWVKNSTVAMIEEACFGSDWSDDESSSFAQPVQGTRYDLIDPPRDPRLVGFVDMSISIE